MRTRPPPTRTTWRSRRSVGFAAHWRSSRTSSSGSSFEATASQPATASKRDVPLPPADQGSVDQREAAAGHNVVELRRGVRRRRDLVARLDPEERRQQTGAGGGTVVDAELGGKVERNEAGEALAVQVGEDRRIGIRGVSPAPIGLAAFVYSNQRASAVQSAKRPSNDHSETSTGVALGSEATVSTGVHDVDSVHVWHLLES
jgi:hypothetical protein